MVMTSLSGFSMVLMVFYPAADICKAVMASISSRSSIPTGAHFQAVSLAQIKSQCSCLSAYKSTAPAVRKVDCSDGFGSWAEEAWPVNSDTQMLRAVTKLGGRGGGERLF